MPNSASNPADPAPDPEYEFRCAVIALASEPGFRLNVALFRDRAIRDDLNARLQRELATRQVTLTTLKLVSGPKLVLSLALEQHLRDQPLPSDQLRALSIFGLEDQLGLAIAGLPGGDEQRGILQTANLHRDIFPRLCPHPVLFWLTENAFRELVRHAPDLWHWRAHTFDFTALGSERSAWISTSTSTTITTGDPLPYRNPEERKAALRLFQDYFAKLDAKGHGESYEAIVALDRIGKIFRDLGEYACAELIFRRSLEICERTLGPEHPHTLGGLNNLANLMLDNGNLAEAEPLYRRALAISERVLGWEHPGTLMSLNNLANLLVDKGDLRGAEPLYRRTLEVQERILGPVHPDTLGSLNNLATLLRTRGDLARAEQLFRRALAGQERILGPEHPDTLGSLNNLATLLANKGDLAGAEPLCRRVLAVRERVFGNEHPDTLSSLSNLSNLLAEKGDMAGAEKLGKRAWHGLLNKFGAAHPDAQMAARAFAEIRSKLAEIPPPH